jgi:hypothetical protein
VTGVSERGVVPAAPAGPVLKAAAAGLRHAAYGVGVGGDAGFRFE